MSNSNKFSIKKINQPTNRHSGLVLQQSPPKNNNLRRPGGAGSGLKLSHKLYNREEIKNER